MVRLGDSKGEVSDPPQPDPAPADRPASGGGGALVEAAIEWAAQRCCRALKTETQNVNLPACRRYARHDFELGAANRF